MEDVDIEYVEGIVRKDLRVQIPRKIAEHCGIKAGDPVTIIIPCKKKHIDRR